MNRNSTQLEAEISKTLGLLDKLPQVEPSPRFRTQLLQRIDSMNKQPGQKGMATSIAVNPKVAFMTLLLMLNIASAMLLFTNESPESASTGSPTLAESFSDDYGGPALSYYDDQSALGR